MKNLPILLASLCLLVLFSCGTKEEIVEIEEFTSANTTEITTRKYPHTHVNPTSIEFTVYTAAAFCGDGFSNQIQIWTSDPNNCQCLLDEFIRECDSEINHLYPCTQTTSFYPPLTELCMN